VDARRRRLSARLRAALLLLLATGQGACVQADGRRFDPIRALTETTEDDEREIGLQFDREIRRVVPVVEDPVVNAFVNEMGQALVAQIEPQPFLYRFRVILDPQLNAFAVPGGFVYLHSGTILAAGSADELAAVLGHEIAHVKARHIARMKEKLAIPSMLTTLASIAAGVAAGAPEVMAAGQGVNVAMQLSFSRELESEADRLGMGFMARGGYDPAEMAKFFERVMLEQGARPGVVPPYLYSHPDVEDRIAGVERMAPGTRVTGTRPAGVDEELAVVQARLTRMVGRTRTTLTAETGPVDRAVVEEGLAAAEKRVAAGDLAGAESILAGLERTQPNDPRVPFRRGELAEQAGRNADAVAAYRRTLRLDPTRAQVLYRLGVVAKADGRRTEAVTAFESAASRFAAGSALQRKALFEVEKLTFPPVVEAGLTNHADARGAQPGDRFGEADARVVWWAKVNPRYLDQTEKLAVRWRDPSGAVFEQVEVEEVGKPIVAGTLALGAAARARPGRWTAEALLEDEVIDRRSFELGP